jgi:O-antigen/teichoic acid export membrane protein
MSGLSVNRNVLANFAGGAWAGLMGLVFVPFYIRLMGIEAYGIVGVFVSLQAMLAILDLGLSQTTSREMARLSVDVHNASRMADTARTVETVYWCVSALAALSVVGMAGFIAQHWLSPRELSRATLQEAIWVMGVVIGLRWPVALYTGAMIGLQRQVLLNVLVAVFATAQGVGALAVLWLVEPTIQAFFAWQGFVALLQVVVLRTVVYRCIAAPGPARFRKEILHDVWRFAAGMTGIALVSILLTQTDKILLSRMLSLTEFGYYTFATTLAGALYALISAVFAAYQPRLAALAAQGDEAPLARTYHQGCQTMAIAIVPVGAVLALFSAEIIGLWTRDERLVTHAALLVSLLVAGNILHGLMHLPYALQLAYGWTRLALVANVIAVVVLVPAIYLAAERWGALGAAAVWIVLNVGYVAFTAQYMHRRLLRGEQRRWYLHDVLAPLLAVAAVAGVGRWLLAADLGTPWVQMALLLVGAAALAAAILSADALRGMFARRLFS